MHTILRVMVVLSVILLLPYAVLGQTKAHSPARVVEKEAILYVEADNLLNLLAGAAAATDTRETILDVALDLTPAERLSLAQSRLAIVLLKKNTVNKGDLPIHFIGILQTPEEKLTNKLSEIIKETIQSLAGSTGTPFKFNAITVGGLGSAIAFGPADALERFFTQAGNIAGNSLEDTPDFQRLRRRNEQASVFVYTTGAGILSLADTFNGQDRAYFELGAKFLGLAAMRAGAFNFTIMPGSAGRLSAIVDSKQTGILPMLAGVPLSNFPGARLAPAQTQFFFTLKVDPGRVYDTIRETFFAGAQNDPLQAMIGPNGRRDLIDNLTGEMAIAVSVDNLADVISKNASPKVQVIGIIEVKDRAAFQPGFTRLIASGTGGQAERVIKHNGIDLFVSKSNAWTYIGNFLVIGPSADVAGAIDASVNATTLATTPAFQSSLRQFAPDGLGFMYVNLSPLLRSSPNFVKLFASLFAGNLPTQIALFAGRADDEIYLETSLTGAGAPALFAVGTVAAIAVPNLLASRRAANGASAVETMRLIHSVEASYQAGIGNGRFGTAADIFREDFIDPVVADALGVPAMTSRGGQVCPGTGKPKNGYLFTLQVTAKGRKFQATALPVSTDGVARTGDRSFFVDDTGVIRATSEPRPARADDPPLGD